jgi:hypothetical protein
MRSITDLGIWLIPIVAIVVWGATEIVKTIMHHQERACPRHGSGRSSSKAGSEVDSLKPSARWRNPYDGSGAELIPPRREGKPDVGSRGVCAH